MMEGVIAINVAPTFQDYLQFNLSYLLRRGWWMAIPAALLLVTFALAPWMPLDGPPDAFSRYRSVGSALIVPGVVFVLMPLLVYIGVRNRWARSAELREAKVYEFSESGVAVKSATSQASTAWSNIDRAETTRALILLYTTQGSAFLIPIQALGDDVERITEFKALLRKHVSNTRRLR